MTREGQLRTPRKGFRGARPLRPPCRAAVCGGGAPSAPRRSSGESLFPFSLAGTALLASRMTSLSQAFPGDFGFAIQRYALRLGFAEPGLASLH
jgi:hypothetical protein